MHFLKRACKGHACRCAKYCLRTSDFVDLSAWCVNYGYDFKCNGCFLHTVSSNKTAWYRMFARGWNTRLSCRRETPRKIKKGTA